MTPLAWIALTVAAVAIVPAISQLNLVLPAATLALVDETTAELARFDSVVNGRHSLSEPCVINEASSAAITSRRQATATGALGG